MHNQKKKKCKIFIIMQNIREIDFLINIDLLNIEELEELEELE